MLNAPASPYDDIAGLYDKFWRYVYLPDAQPALEKLLFQKLPAQARILDVCCGSGHVTRELVRRGYQVTGVDSSEGLIALARQHLPGVDLRLQDARTLELDGPYDGAISTFDSLNHMLSLKELEQVLLGIHGCLEREGLLVFDMNMEEAYSADVREWTVDVSDRSVGLARGTYDVLTKIARTEVIWFVRMMDDHLWKQHQTVVEQRCYQESEILLALRQTGFRHLESVSAKAAGITSELAAGRIFFVARA